MPSAKDIEQKVREIIAEQLGISEEDISGASSFVDDLGADALDVVEVVMAVEEEFSIEIPETDSETFDLVSDLIGYVRERLTG